MILSFHPPTFMDISEKCPTIQCTAQHNLHTTAEYLHVSASTVCYRSPISVLLIENRHDFSSTFCVLHVLRNRVCHYGLIFRLREVLVIFFPRYIMFNIISDVRFRFSVLNHILMALFRLSLYYRCLYLSRYNQ